MWKIYWDGKSISESETSSVLCILVTAVFSYNCTSSYYIGLLVMDRWSSRIIKCKATVHYWFSHHGGFEHKESLVIYLIIMVSVGVDCYYVGSFQHWIQLEYHSSKSDLSTHYLQGMMAEENSPILFAMNPCVPYSETRICFLLLLRCSTASCFKSQSLWLYSLSTPKSWIVVFLCRCDYVDLLCPGVHKQNLKTNGALRR